MRSVVLNHTQRCQRCQLPPRWCICAAQVSIHTPLQISLLTHKRELHRPSSTGNLIKRLFPGASQHAWKMEAPPAPEAVLQSGREVWLLHPDGPAVPADADPARIQLLLPDGSWSETAAMTRSLATWGRLVSLPLSGSSRYWLREAQGGNRFSTAEALCSVLELFNQKSAAQALRVQFELHVYAGLRSRGLKDIAQQYLAGSVLQAALADFLVVLNTRRPLPEHADR